MLNQHVERGWLWRQGFLNLNIPVCRSSWCDAQYVQRTIGNLLMLCWAMELCSEVLSCNVVRVHLSSCC